MCERACGRRMSVVDVRVFVRMRVVSASGVINKTRRPTIAEFYDLNSLWRGKKKAISRISQRLAGDSYLPFFKGR